MTAAVAPRFDVWFCDDGRWRIDTARVTREVARQLVAENTDAGYDARIVPHNPDGASDRPTFDR